MSKLYFCGAELDGFLDANVSAARDSQFISSTTGTVTRDTGTKRSGLASFKCDSGAGNAAAYVSFSPLVSLISLNTGESFFWCGYFYFSHLPGSTIPIVHCENTTQDVEVRLTSGGKLQLWTSAQLGSDSSATVSTGSWYRVEVRVKSVSGSDEFELRVNGTAEVNTTSAVYSDSTQSFAVSAGWWSAPGASKVCFVDDVACNKSDGSANNSWVGAHRVIMALPISDGSIGSGWTAGAGGTSNLYDAINNNPPAGLATETNTSQIECNSNSGSSDATFVTNTYTDLGLTGSETVGCIYVSCHHAEDISTGTKTGNLALQANPDQSGNFVGFTYGGGSGAATDWGAASSTWREAKTGFFDDQSVTAGTGITMRVRKTDTTTRVAQVCFLGTFIDIGESTNQTYNETATLTASATASQSGLGTFPQSVTLTKNATLSSPGGVAYTDSLTLAQNATTALAGYLNISPSLALAAAAAMTPEAVLAALGSLTLSQNATTTQSSLWSGSVPVTLTADASVPVSSILTTSGAASLAAAVQAAASGGLNLSDSVTLSAAAAQVASGYLSIASTISMAINSTITPGGTFNADALATLSSQLGLTPAGLLEIAATVQLANQTGVANAGPLTIATSIAFANANAIVWTDSLAAGNYTESATLAATAAMALAGQLTATLSAALSADAATGQSALGALVGAMTLSQDATMAVSSIAIHNLALSLPANATIFVNDGGAINLQLALEAAASMTPAGVATMYSSVALVAAGAMTPAGYTASSHAVSLGAQLGVAVDPGLAVSLVATLAATGGVALGGRLDGVGAVMLDTNSGIVIASQLDISAAIALAIAAAKSYSATLSAGALITIELDADLSAFTPAVISGPGSYRVVARSIVRGADGPESIRNVAPESGRRIVAVFPVKEVK